MRCLYGYSDFCVIFTDSRTGFYANNLNGKDIGESKIHAFLPTNKHDKKMNDGKRTTIFCSRKYVVLKTKHCKLGTLIREKTGTSLIQKRRKTHFETCKDYFVT